VLSIDAASFFAETFSSTCFDEEEFSVAGTSVLSQAMVTSSVKQNIKTKYRGCFLVMIDGFI
jgi:hypothetical protein